MADLVEIYRRWNPFMWPDAGEVGIWLVTLAALVLAVWLLRARLSPLLACLWPARAPIMALLVGAGILIIPAQGRELALGLPQSAGRWWLPAAVLAWSFQAWLWTRLSLYATFGSDRDLWPNRPVIEWLPRALATLVHLLAIVALGMAGWRLYEWQAPARALWSVIAVALVVALLGVILQLVLTLRHAWRQRMHERRPDLDDLLDLRVKIPPNSSLRLVCVALGPIGRSILGAALVSGVLLIGWLGRKPVEAGALLGTAPILFLALGIWTAVGSILAIMSSRLKVPLLLCAILLGFAMNLSRDWHNIRIVPDDIARDAGGPAIADRPSLRQALAQWQEDPPPVAGGKIPLVIVAAEGGGLRAAYWTATALGRMADRMPESFPKALLAISAVSGGSLGALVHVSLHAAVQRGDLAPGQQEAAAAALLSHDFLAAPTAALLTSDTLGNALPNFLGFGGRGTALENAWNTAWPKPENPTAGRGWWNPLDAPFLSLWRKDIPGRRPQLLLNATHQETGRRVIESSIRIDDAYFHDAWDLHVLTGCDIWASTAVHNSARFTYVSPAGALRAAYAEPPFGGAIGQDRAATRCDPQSPELRPLGHLLDGGYFENYGAVTALELAEALSGLLSDRYRLVVVLLSNDIGAVARDYVTQVTACPAEGGTLDFVPRTDRPAWYEAAWNELTAPVTGVLASRVARSALAARMLARWASCGPEQANMPERVFVHIAMCRSELDAPLGWVMGDTSRRNIQDQLGAGCNTVDWWRLMNAVGGVSIER